MKKSFDLKQKKVIDVKTAELVGYIRGMDIDVESGRINSVTIPRNGIRGFFMPEKSITVPWDSVTAIGREFVLIRRE